MRSKLQQLPNFQAFDAIQDSIELLKAMKGLAFRFDSRRYTPQSMVDIDTRPHRNFQSEDMTNTQCHDKFKNMIAVIKHCNGEVGTHPGLVQDETQVMTGSSFDPSATHAHKQRYQKHALMLSMNT